MSASRWRITVLRGFAEATRDDKLREIALKEIAMLEAAIPSSAPVTPPEPPETPARVI